MPGQRKRTKTEEENEIMKSEQKLVAGNRVYEIKENKNMKLKWRIKSKGVT